MGVINVAVGSCIVPCQHMGCRMQMRDRQVDIRGLNRVRFCLRRDVHLAAFEVRIEYPCSLLRSGPSAAAVRPKIWVSHIARTIRTREGATSDNSCEVCSKSAVTVHRTTG